MNEIIGPSAADRRSTDRCLWLLQGGHRMSSEIKTPDFIFFFLGAPTKGVPRFNSKKKEKKWIKTSNGWSAGGGAADPWPWPCVSRSSPLATKNGGQNMKNSLEKQKQKSSTKAITSRFNWSTLDDDRLRPFIPSAFTTLKKKKKKMNQIIQSIKYANAAPRNWTMRMIITIIKAPNYFLFKKKKEKKSK